MALLLYLTVVSWTVIASLGTQCQQNSAVNQMRKGRPHQFYPSPISDHVLRGKVYRTITTRSHATCAVLCLQEDVCRSFNFCQYERRCELNSAVYTKDKSDLYPSNGCLYFDEEYHRECRAYESVGDYDYNFIFPPLNSSDKFTFDFAAKGEKTAILSLSEQANETNCYEIQIGGWGNTLSAIRCGKVCERRYVEVSTPGIMDGSEYRRFWLSYDNGTIQVGKGGEVTPFMEWHDATHRVQVNYIGIARYKEPVSWIAYTYCDE